MRRVADDIVLEDNRDLSAILAKKAMPKKEYFTVPTDDGEGPLLSFNLIKF